MTIVVAFIAGVEAIAKEFVSSKVGATCAEVDDVISAVLFVLKVAVVVYAGGCVVMFNKLMTIVSVFSLVDSPSEAFVVLIDGDRLWLNIDVCPTVGVVDLIP